ncbi:MAG TPA: IclR family transcriptional regulator [Caldimonas sp.]|jgi:DNA-binding IclR family transcriptional regulator|nr:IclR family transcriptional regulator [Caldimonas sp.]HEX2542698.1 IclR family transcriptional regulator [Caldimonas sp.]
MPTTREALGAAAASDGSAAGRSLALLSLLASAGRPLSLAELAARLVLPKATAHRICEQLVDAGYLARDIRERSFIAGPALHRLAFDTLNCGVVRGLRHDVLAELVARIGETCNFTTLDGTRVLYIDRVEAAWPLRLTLDVGSHVPLHCTASGKLFLAAMPEDEREAVLSRLALPRMTAKTITSAKALRAECIQIAKAGYSCDRAEFIAGLIAVAVPVRDEEGTVRAAIAVHAPEARMSLRDAVGQLAAMQAAAKRMQALV